MPSGLFYLSSLHRSIYTRRGVWYVLLFPCFIEKPVFTANCVDPDQTPHSAAFDLGLHCLHVSLLLDARHKLVKENGYTFCIYNISKMVLPLLIHVMDLDPSEANTQADLRLRWAHMQFCWFCCALTHFVDDRKDIRKFSSFAF